MNVHKTSHATAKEDIFAVYYLMSVACSRKILCYVQLVAAPLFDTSHILSVQVKLYIS